jgi:hypothetical protein
MRDFRDAKAMAHALRDALKNRAAEITHSESLELIAKAFGYENWNILAAKIEAAKSHAMLAPAATQEPTPPKTLYCSFCGKSQHEVRKLIAGPSVYICDECVELCTDIIRDEDGYWELLSLLTAGKTSGNDTYQTVLDHMRGRSTEDVASYVERSRRAAEDNRLLAQVVHRKLAMAADEQLAADDVLSSPKFAYLNRKSKEELLKMEQDAQRTVKRFDDALRIGATVLAERGQ